MRMYEIIQKKQRGEELTEEEIRFFANGYVNGSIHDDQAAALCMAIWFRGMTVAETTALTLAIRDSGERLSLDRIQGIRVDKHSTGGVGDKTSLVVGPVLASLGVKVAKMSGRGLGHTGGTIDKLESIQGFRSELSMDEFIKVVNRVGIAIVGQSKELAPADKKLYTLRDVTATVDSIPLIASSIMGKKLAADDDCIVLDVKTGSGAFAKTLEKSRELASLMVEIGKRAGKKMTALVTDMDRPLGYMIGNTLEVYEAIEVLFGGGPDDLKMLCCELSTQLLYLAGKGSLVECRKAVDEAIRSGAALNKFSEMVEAQGGNKEWVLHPEQIPVARHQREIKAEKSGYLFHMDAEACGTAALLLGAGRNSKEDRIDPTAGIRLCAKTGDFVEAGETIAILYCDHEELFEQSEERFLSALQWSEEKPELQPLILDFIQ